MTRYEWLQQEIEKLKRHHMLPVECIEWPYAKKSGGYGLLSIGGKTYLVHRLAYALYYGKDPQEFVLHKCSNPACFNVSHLYEGGYWENCRDQALAEKFAVSEGMTGKKLRKIDEFIHRHREAGIAEIWIHHPHPRPGSGG